MRKEYDVIVAGSGAGGATVAREMALRGRKVALLERGGRFNIMGTTMTCAMIYKNFGFTRSREKYNIVFADNYGGASNLAAGCALPPQDFIFAPHGISLAKEADEARRDMRIQKMPDEIIGTANLRIMEAANSAGYNWGRLDNFVDAARCNGNGQCMLGCRTGAKWTARVYGDEAVKNGAELMLHTRAEEIIVENGKAVGIRARRFGKRIALYGRKIVLSSGVDNVHMLRHAGITEAGKGMCCDWLQFVGGIIPGINTLHAKPMSVGTIEHYEAEGIIITPVFPNWAMFAAALFFTGIGRLPLFPRYWRYSGIMVKVRDETAGNMVSGMNFSKPVSAADRKKLDRGVDIIKRIFRRAGAEEGSILALKPMGAHPSATCRIGEVVDSNLETRIKNLYCCDASVFPASLGTPVVWTVVSLGKRLSKHLEKGLENKQ